MPSSISEKIDRTIFEMAVSLEIFFWVVGIEPMTSDGLLICRPSLEATIKVLFNHSLDRAQCVYVAEKSANVDTGTVVELREDDVVVMTKDLKSVKVGQSLLSFEASLACCPNQGKHQLRLRLRVGLLW